MSWTVLAAAVTPMTTTACRAVAAAMGALGALAGGLAAPASCRSHSLCSLACLFGQLWQPWVLPQLTPASSQAHCCAMLEAPAAACPGCQPLPSLPMGRAPCREAGPGTHHLEPSVAAHVYPPVLNHSRSIKCHCCKPRWVPGKGSRDHLGEPSPCIGFQEEAVDGGRKEGALGSRPHSS